MEELKPCPFCNSHAMYYFRDFGFQKDEENSWDIICTKSGCYLDEGAEYWLSKKDITELWNKRTP